MLGFEHLAALLIFILLGGFGMAAMQDGTSVIWKHLRTMIANRNTGRALPRHQATQPLMFRR